MVSNVRNYMTFFYRFFIIRSYMFCLYNLVTNKSGIVGNAKQTAGIHIDIEIKKVYLHFKI